MPPRSVDTDGLERGLQPDALPLRARARRHGLAERICEQRDVLLARALRLIESCPCTEGCPACVGPVRTLERSESSDRDNPPGELSRGHTRKSVALALLGEMVGVGATF